MYVPRNLPMACPVVWGHLAWPAPTGAQSDPVPTLEEGTCSYYSSLKVKAWVALCECQPYETIVACIYKCMD